MQFRAAIKSIHLTVRFDVMFDEKNILLEILHNNKNENKLTKIFCFLYYKFLFYYFNIFNERK